VELEPPPPPGFDAGVDAGVDAGTSRRPRHVDAPPPVLRLPMGWIVSSKTSGYARGANGRPRRARAPEYHDAFPVVAEETHGDEAYAVAHDGAMYRVRDIAIARPATELPEGVGESDRWIDVNLEQQTLVAYQGLTPVFATLISSGRVRDPDDPTQTFATPTGIFRITSKHVTHTMDGDHAVDGPYSIEDVPYVMYFQLAYAIHSAFWHNGFGHPRSHGCVNMAPLDARWLFNWATPSLPAGWHAIFPSEADPGTWIWIHGETPEG
jgi:lipoprotein-anchoring transpeptidase ErfK/SrfK